MTETGWPLIPREVLPAPVRPARVARRPPPPAHADGGRQLSIFGAETTEPSPADLAGLLAGPGRLGRIGGTARVSVRVDAAWRVHVLVAELVSRGLVVSWSPIATKEVRRSAPREADGPPRHNGGDVAGSARPRVPPLAGDSGAEWDGDADDPALAFEPDADGVVVGSGRPRPESPAAEEEPESPTTEKPQSPTAEVPEFPTAERPVFPTAEAAASGGDAPGNVDPEETIDGPPERPEPELAFEVRTAYSSRLNALALAWPAAADQLFLSGPGLRLWVAAAGRPAADGFALGLGVDPDPGKSVKAVDSALRRAGLEGSLSDDGRAYLITGRSRLARLAELVGERPESAPAALWPGGPAA